MSGDPSDLRARALATASAALSARFPGAAFAFVAGSIIRGQGTVASDIDMVVIFDRLDTAWRESFVFESFPVEAFVHDPETIAWFMEQDVARNYPIIINMIAEGQVIGPAIEQAGVLKTAAAEILNGGPPPLTGEKLDLLRYQISDLLDDLRGSRTPAELRAIGAKLYQPLADLILLGRGRWSGQGKWIPRLIGQLDDNLLREFDAAFQRLSDGRPEAVITVSEHELARHGGILFAGDRRKAPAEARKAKQT